MIAPAKFIVLFFVWIHSLSATAQYGMYESLLGNSGVATKESTASSYYNPALLIDRKSHSFVLSGNTLAVQTSEFGSSRLSSSSLAPNYLSSISKSPGFVQEFFILKTLSIDGTVETTDSILPIGLALKFDQYFFGYSFALGEFPIGFQVAGFYSEQKMVGRGEFVTNPTRGSVFLESQMQSIDGVLGLGFRHRFGSYQLGVRYLSRPLVLSQSKSGISRVSVYNDLDKSFVQTETKSEPGFDRIGQLVMIGHSFSFGQHEVLTDSLFAEQEALALSFIWKQSFGYRLRFSNNTQYLCGLQLGLGENIRIGDDFYSSTGLSWLNNTFRSTAGVFFRRDRKLSSEGYGISFSTEFLY